MTEWWVEICPYPDCDGEYHAIGPYKTERDAERAERGVQRNLNYNDYYTMVSSTIPSQNRNGD